MKTSKRKSRAGTVFDMVFEIVLILVVLSAALIFSRDDVVAGPEGYRIEPVSLIITFGLLIFFIIFVVSVSVKKQKQDRERDGEKEKS